MACRFGNLEMVKYLHSQGGEMLLMMTDAVSALEVF
jgi:hypothetical protein